jgi:hypothetical protein
MRIDPAAFVAVIRSVDAGLPIDIERIRERMETALNGGALQVALAQGEIAISAGQLRLANTAVQVKGAELGVRMDVDLASGAMNARLSLAGSGASDAPKGLRPEVTVTVRGPITAPKRSLDVAAFTNWLALRAIEDKDKRIDALQSGRETALPPAPPAVEPAPAAPPQTAPPSQAAAPAQTAAPVPERAPEPKQPKPRPAPRPPAAKAPPPTDIRPPAAAKAQQQTPPARPAASPSWLENLFGP